MTSFLPALALTAALAVPVCGPTDGGFMDQAVVVICAVPGACPQGGPDA